MGTAHGWLRYADARSPVRSSALQPVTPFALGTKRIHRWAYRSGVQDAQPVVAANASLAVPKAPAVSKFSRRIRDA